MTPSDLFRAIIIGAGPAGIMCAIQATKTSGDTLLIERNSLPGRKLSIAGSGQCNITHEGPIRDFFTHYGEHGKFLRPALMNFTNAFLISFFRERGLEMVINPDGKVFPASLKSSDVIRVLTDECHEKQLMISYGDRISAISREREIFTVQGEKGTYQGKNIVIATGGTSYPSTGSTGDGYRFAGALGHTINEIAPALAPAMIEQWPFRDLAGISFERIQFTLWRDGVKTGSHQGDLLFTHRGVSGPGILDYSRYMHPGDLIKVNFIGNVTKDLFLSDFMAMVSSHPVSLVRTALGSFGIPERLVVKLLEYSEIPSNTTCAHLSREQRIRLIGAVTGFPLKIRLLGGPEEAMVTRGGVALEEINPKTMESRIIPGLFCIGEVLDVDGDTGGYNIQAAFSTGYLAGNHIRQKSWEACL
jgi:predicted Rossmann fold flavoprotein